MAKILIIEDEAGIRSFLEQGLSEEGYEVVSSADGRTGLEMALSIRPDILLLDWMLPEMSGLEACREFRKKDRETPILFLTAKDTLQETIEGLRTGANDYIKKPFSFEELLERIRVQLRSRQDRHRDIEIGPVTLSPSLRRAYRYGVPVNLTQREFELLSYLATHRNEVCTRKQIINEVWDIHFDYDTGVIDVFINSIRRKLALERDQDFIRAVRGVGYIAEF